MLEAQGLTVRKLAYYFLLLLPLSAATMLAIVQMHFPRDVEGDLVVGMSVFLSAGCIGVIFFQNWKIFARQELVALACGAFIFYVMHLI